MVLLVQLIGETFDLSFEKKKTTTYLCLSNSITASLTKPNKRCEKHTDLRDVFVILTVNCSDSYASIFYVILSSVARSFCVEFFQTLSILISCKNVSKTKSYAMSVHTESARIEFFFISLHSAFHSKLKSYTSVHKIAVGVDMCIIICYVHTFEQ